MMPGRRRDSATGTFNFGPPVTGLGFVTFHGDAELVGEHSGGAATTIASGFYPVRSFGPTSAAVREIAFDAPLHGALFFEGPPDADTEIDPRSKTDPLIPFNTVSWVASSRNTSTNSAPTRAMLFPT